MSFFSPTLVMLIGLFVRFLDVPAPEVRFVGRGTPEHDTIGSILKERSPVEIKGRVRKALTMKGILVMQYVQGNSLFSLFVRFSFSIQAKRWTSMWQAWMRTSRCTRKCAKLWVAFFLQTFFSTTLVCALSLISFFLF